MGSVICGKDYNQWFAELNVDLDKVLIEFSLSRASLIMKILQVLEITRIILNLYEMWKNFDEKKETPALLLKMPKPKTQPTR